MSFPSLPPSLSFSLSLSIYIYIYIYIFPLPSTKKRRRSSKKNSEQNSMERTQHKANLPPFQVADEFWLPPFPTSSNHKFHPYDLDSIFNIDAMNEFENELNAAGSEGFGYNSSTV